MAKIKFGMMMTDARGKLGGQVFSKNRAGAYVRTKVTPSNPRTIAQMESRAILGAQSSAWNQLTDPQRLTWEGAVENWKKTDIFGDLKTPSGKSLFVRINKNLEQSAQTTLLIAPDKMEIPVVSATGVAIDITATEISFDGLTSVPADMVMQVRATEMLPAGVNYVKNRLRVIGYIPAGAITATDVWADYVAKFGAPVADANIKFEVKFIGVNGQAGVPLIFKASVS